MIYTSFRFIYVLKVKIFQSVAVVANFTKGTDKVWAYLQDLIDNAADFKNGATFEKSAEDVVA